MVAEKKNNDDLLPQFIALWSIAALSIIHSIKRSWLVLLVCIGLGLQAVVVRACFLRIIPILQHHLEIVTVIVDTLTTIFVTMENAMILIIDVVKDVIRLFVHNRKKPSFHFHAYKLLSTAEVANGLTNLAVTCPKFNTMPKIMSFVTKQTFNKYTCPVIRAMQPTVLHKVTKSALGWTSYPSDMYQSSSCTEPPGTDEMWICSGIGIGYVLLEVALPLLLIPLLLPALAKAAFKTSAIIYKVVQSALNDVGSAYHAAVRLCSTLFEKADDFVMNP